MKRGRSKRGNKIKLKRKQRKRYGKGSDVKAEVEERRLGNRKRKQISNQQGTKWREKEQEMGNLEGHPNSPCGWKI